MYVDTSLANGHIPRAAFLKGTRPRGHTAFDAMAVKAARRRTILTCSTEHTVVARVAEAHAGALACRQGLAARKAASTPVASPTHAAHGMLMHRHAVVAHEDILLAACGHRASSPRGATALLAAVKTLCEASRHAPRAVFAERLSGIAVFHECSRVAAPLTQALPCCLCGSRLRGNVRCELANTRRAVALTTRLSHPRLARLLVAASLVLARERRHDVCASAGQSIGSAGNWT